MTEKRLKLPQATLEALQDLADRRGESIDKTLRHCINTEIYIDEQLVRGNKILCQEPSGKTWKVVFGHAI